MRPLVLRKLIEGDAYMNVHGVAREESGRSGTSEDGIRREKLNEYHDRRIAFEASFTQGREFRYGALNIGGIGTDKYGELCAVLSPDWTDVHKSIAYLRSDSLRHYVTRDCSVKLDTLRRDVATGDSRHCLAALKHGDRIADLAVGDWAMLVCSSEEYIEAVFVGDVTRDDFVEVRISKDEYDRLWESTFMSFCEPLDEAVSELTANFKAILQADSDGQIHLRKI